MDTVEQAAQVLIEHTRTRIEDCHCGWGVNTGALGQSHALHVAHALADAGLLAVREKPTALDQLAPGDHIWVDEAWREVIATGWDADEGNGDVTVYLKGREDFTAPAALLVRRAER
jgi:hypothetical protein